MADHNVVLDLWAKKDAAKDIAKVLHLDSVGLVYKIVAAARAGKDPRALFRKGRASKGRTYVTKREIERGRPALRRNPIESGEQGRALDGWSFAKRTIFVTTLGIGSSDCWQVPVSVSCVPTKKAPPRATGGATCVVSVCRSLAEAMALHPLHGARQDAGGQSRTEPVAPLPPR